MPQTPYARILVSVNSGPPAVGGLEAQYGDTLQLSAESTVGWSIPAAVWEITTYPAGWGPPPGWSVDPVTRAYVITGNLSTLPAFSLPPATSNLWGKWKFRLRVNGGGGPLTDTATGVEIVSPSGLHDLAASEESEFGAERSWVGPHQQNLRVLDRVIGGGTVPIGVTPPLRNTGSSGAPVLAIDPVSDTANGAMLAADKARLDAATAAATPDTLVARDPSGASIFFSVSASGGYFIPPEGVFTLTQLQAASGDGGGATIRAQQGALNHSGGALTLGGGDPGSPGRAGSWPGPTYIQLGTPDSTSQASAVFRLLAGSAGFFLTIQYANGSASVTAASAFNLWAQGSSLNLDATGLQLTVPLVGWVNAALEPKTNPPNGVSVYAFAGSLYARSPNGVVTALVAAGTPGGTTKLCERLDGNVQTQGTTAATVVSYAPPINCTGQMTLDIVAYCPNSTARSWFCRKYRFYRGSGGSPSIRGAGQVPVPDDDMIGGCTVIAAVNAYRINVNVTGINEMTVQWRATGTLEFFVP